MLYIPGKHPKGGQIRIKTLKCCRDAHPAQRLTNFQQSLMRQRCAWTIQWIACLLAQQPTTFKTDIRHEWIPFSWLVTTLRGGVAQQKRSDKLRLISAVKAAAERNSRVSEGASLNHWQQHFLKSFMHAHAFWSHLLLLRRLSFRLVGTSIHFPFCYASAQDMTFPLGASLHN